MANKRRADEDRAQATIQAVTGIALDHADVNGQADFLSVDGVTSAVEVTRVTDGERKSTPLALGKFSEHDARLHTCWLVTVADSGVRVKNLVARLVEPVLALERAGRGHFMAQRDAVDLIMRVPGSEMYRPLLDAKIDDAVAVDDGDRSDHVHSIHIMLTGGGTASDSDTALELLEDELKKPKRDDNPKKLILAARDQRHLFVWLDWHTEFGIARALQKDDPVHFGLPSRPPKLSSGITHLWVVHEGSGQGWYWNGERWESVQAAA